MFMFTKSFGIQQRVCLSVMKADTLTAMFTFGHIDLIAVESEAWKTPSLYGIPFCV